MTLHLTLKVGYWFGILPLSLLLGWPSLALAQVIPDTTLDTEASQVHIQENQLLIGGGSDRAPVLFHSFEQFSIANDQQVVFASPPAIESIITRVTGTRPSSIDGTLAVPGSAHLFLLNPNGILFGPNAQLDIAGSFSASTADSMRVGDFDFSAVNPTPVPLLTLNVNPGIQFGQNTANRLIQNQANLTLGKGHSLTLNAGTLEQSGQIRIPAGMVTLQGERLELIGTVDTRVGGNPGGRLQVRSPSDLTIQPSGPLTNQAISNALQTNKVAVESDRDLTLVGTLSSTSNNSLTLTAGRTLRLLADNSPSGSDISELTGHLTLQSRGNVFIENPLHITTPQSPAHLTLEAEGTVTLRVNELTNLPEQVESDRIRLLQLTGNDGTLAVHAKNLVVQNSAIRTIAGDNSTGPDIDIMVERDLSLQRSVIDTRVGPGQKGGMIHIQAGQSLNADTSAINTGGFIILPPGITGVPGVPDIVANNPDPLAQTGDIQIDVGDTLLLQGSQIRTTSFAGDAGSMRVSAQQLVLDGSDQTSIISTDTNFDSTGDAGSITIEASDSLELIGNQPGPFVIPNPLDFTLTAIADIIFNSTIISAPSLGAGLSSPITIRTRRLKLKDKAFLGNAAGLLQDGGQSGEVTLIANDIHLQGLAGIASVAFGNGNGGNLVVESDRLTLEDGAILAVSSVIGTGDAGTLSINTNQLTISGGSTIAANTESGGRGGILDIHARSIRIDGTSANGRVPSTLRTGVSPGARGRGRTLRLHTNRLHVLNGAEIRAGTQGSPDAGNITINANQITVDGVGPRGRPSIIQTESLVSPDTENTDVQLGAAGNIRISAERLTVSDRAEISTQSQQGDGGDIRFILDEHVLLRRGGHISATAGVAGTGGDGGNIYLDTGFIIAPGDEDSDITANAFEGAGGNITLRTNALLLGIAFREEPTDFSDITASSQFGLAGIVTIEGGADELAPTPLQLPSGLATSEDRLVTGCRLDENANFIVTGRGGLPANPHEMLHQSLIWQDPRIMTMAGEVVGTTVDIPTMMEAKGWHVNENGQTELLASLKPLRVGVWDGCRHHQGPKT